MRWPVRSRAIVSAVVLAILLAGCGSGGPGPELVTLGAVGGAIARQPNVREARPQTWGSMMLCLNRPGSVRVTDVRAVQSTSSFKIVEFGLRQSPFWKRSGPAVGTEYGDLAKIGFSSNHTVNVTCDSKTGRAYELAVVVERSGPSTASMRGFDIEYSSHGKRQSLMFPLQISLCPGKC